MFRRLRDRIIFSFCILMIAGGAFSVSLVSRNLTTTLGATVDRGGIAQAQILAGRLTEPLAYADRLTARDLLVGFTVSNPDLIYAFVQDADGRVREHSYPAAGFPMDLLVVAETREPSTLAAEVGHVRNLPYPVAEGELGVLHLGVSMAWVDAATGNAVENVLATTVIAMFVGILGILFLAELITRPLLALGTAAARFGTGEADIEVPVVGSDELAELARTFNQMSGQIRNRMEESEALRSYVARVLDQMESSIVVVSQDLRVEYANSLAERVYGPLVGTSCHAVMEQDRPCGECPVQEVIECGTVLRRTFKAPSGRTYELKWLPILGRDGQPAVVERALDITERIEIRERLERAQRLAVAGEAAAGVVHSVNNPLDGVRRALELAESRPDDPERVRRMLALAREGTDRIAEITRTLLGFARGDREPDPVPVRVGSLVEAAVSLSRLRAEARGVTMAAVVEADLPAVRLDPQGMEEVLVNLLLNASDACEAGGAVRVTARIWNGGLEVSVDDSGPGVPEADAQRVFEPFFTTKDATHGTGLGLPMARRVTEAHGGALVLESSDLGGARFVVRIPLTSGAAEGHA